MLANRLKIGDEIRVVAPSRSLSVVREDIFSSAYDYLISKGFKVTFSKHSKEIDNYNSSSILSRVEDLHDAFMDKNVKAILSCVGGFNVNQILEYIDYNIIEENPKIICGYSDITALLNTIYAKTGLVTYHGPHFSSFGFDNNRSYTNMYFEKCLMNYNTYNILPSGKADRYISIQDGVCEGKIIGGNLCTLNLLQGTEYMPDLTDSILFIEDDNIMGELFVYEFERNFQSLLQNKNSDKLKGIVFGRFDNNCHITKEDIERIVSTKKQLKNMPIVFNVDFGHVFPFVTFPIGGRAKVSTSCKNIEISITEH